MARDRMGWDEMKGDGKVRMEGEGMGYVEMGKGEVGDRK